MAAHVSESFSTGGASVSRSGDVTIPTTPKGVPEAPPVGQESLRAVKPRDDDEYQANIKKEISLCESTQSQQNHVEAEILSDSTVGKVEEEGE